MTTKTLDISTDLDKDSLGREIGLKWASWDAARTEWKERYKEVLQYLYATKTDEIIGQASQPWKSNTHIPKMTQLRDLLVTYYAESLFSLDNYIEWKASSANSDVLTKRNLIRDYVKDLLDRGNYRRVVDQLLEDYVDSGNAFATPEWVVETVKTRTGIKEKFKGVKILRINPMDIVFDPLAVDFASTPKILRTIKTLGEIKSLSDKDPAMQKAFKRIVDNRNRVREAMSNGDDIVNNMCEIAGFGNMSTYMASDTCELLTFIGDLYDSEKDKLYKNAKIVVMDRCVVLSNETFEDTDSFNLIFHAGWRRRKDTLWAMSPLENLLGMQFRIDYLENKRADVYDFTSNPILLTLGEVELPEEIRPGVHISGDATATVRYLAPDVSILQSSTLMAEYMAQMEEFAGAPREMAGFRTPGEKTAFEYSQMLTAAQRIFQKKIRNFELMTEELINAALSLQLHKSEGQTLELKVWDDKAGVYAYKKVTVEDIKGDGAIRAIGSVSFADKAQLAQNLTQLGNSGLFMDPSVLANISPAKLGETLIHATGLDRVNGLFKTNSRLYEQAEQQKLNAQLLQEVQQELSQPTVDDMMQADTATMEALYAQSNA